MGCINLGPPQFTDPAHPCFGCGNPLGLGVGGTDALYRGFIHRQRAFPFRMFGSAASSGVYYDPVTADPYELRRCRHTSPYTRCTSIDPPEQDLAAAQQYIRFSLDQRTGAPPHLSPLMFALYRRCNPAVMGQLVGGCQDSTMSEGRWHRGGFTLHSQAEGPPRLMTSQLYTRIGVIDPDTGLPGADADLSRHMADSPEMDEYNNAALIPVPPHSAWGEGYPGVIPYPDGAPFVFSEGMAYEIPCYHRLPPWRHVNPTTAPSPAVGAGAQAIVAQAEHVQMADQWQWTYGGQAGYCNVPYMIENMVKRMRGTTGTKRYNWVEDPENRGWWIEYRAEFVLWFARNYNWFHSENPPESGQTCVRGGNADQGGCWTRWNVWYEGQTAFKTNGNVSDAAFRAWIELHDEGYGSRWKPASSHCNDVLLSCAGGMTDAMGDVLVPSQERQDACAATASPPPCLDAELGRSFWYTPDPPADDGWGDLAPSLHPVMHVPQWPETGLLHAVTREILDHQGQVVDTATHWASLHLTTTTPLIGSIGAPAGTVNEVQRLQLSCPTPEGEMSGGFVVGRVTDDPDLAITVDATDTPAEVQAKMEAASWGAGNVIVTGVAGEYYDVEYTGLYWRRPQPLMVLLSNFLWCVDPETGGDNGDVTITRLQRGGDPS